jgi:hypothetical protein
MAIQHLHSQHLDTLEDATHHFLSAVRLENELENQDGALLDLLETLLHRYGSSFVKALSAHLDQLANRDSDSAMTLTLLGRVEHAKTRSSRMNLLLENLSSQRVRVRDGAVAGLGYMMSKDAIPTLKTATKAETNRYLRRDMEHLLKLLMEM